MKPSTEITRASGSPSWIWSGARLISVIAWTDESSGMFQWDFNEGEIARLEQEITATIATLGPDYEGRVARFDMWVLSDDAGVTEEVERFYMRYC